MFNPLKLLFPMIGANANQDPTSGFWYGPVGSPTPSGVNVTATNAEKVSAVYGCMRLLRETLGYLPFFVYKVTGEDSQEKATDYFLFDVLHKKPNSWQTPFQFIELGVNHLYLEGNFYCLIRGQGDDTELWPLDPRRMKIVQQPDGRLRYDYRTKTGELIEYDQEDIYHVVGQSFDGITGVSVIEFARNTIGSTIAQEDHGASLFKNGGLPAFYISRPAEKKWTDQAQKNFRKGWRQIHGGAENAGNPPILSDGMTIESLSLSNRDSQWLESRLLSAEEICRFFGVPPHMIGVQTKATARDTAEQGLNFLKYTMLPLASRFEQSANLSLVDDPDKHFTKFNLDALERSVTLDRYEAHNISLQGGWKTVNEVRDLENLNPRDGGDELQSPLNMQPLGGGPDENEQGGRPGKGTPKPPQENEDDAEPNALKNRENEKRLAAQASFAILLDEAAERIASAEIKALSARADKAAEDHGKWREWVADVYDKHAVYTKKTLSPLFAAWRELKNSSGWDWCDVDMEIATLKITAYGLPSPNQICKPDTDIPALLETWKTTRAGELAAILKEEFFNES